MDNQQKSNIYTCPMHPEIKQDKPGNCPKCGMNLVLVKAETDTTTSIPEEKKDFGAKRNNSYNNATQNNNVTVASTSSEALEANKNYINKKKLIRISGTV